VLGGGGAGCSRGTLESHVARSGVGGASEGGGPPEPACAEPVGDGAYVMGTVLEITLVPRAGVGDGTAEEARADARLRIRELLDRAAELDELFSSHREQSGLSRLNRAAGRGLQPVDPRLAAILRHAIAYTRETGGAFDVTVGPVVDLWIRAARRDRPPDAAEVRTALERVGPERVRVEGERVALAPGTRVELGALAKGWALDRLAEELANARMCGALLDFGQSSLRGLGRAPGGGPWTVALRGGEGTVLGLVRLRDRALSVSGSLGQWSEIGGVRYGHVVDPRTGWALREGRVAAVVAPTAAAAEAWSTALVVAGRSGLAAVEARPDTEALVQTEAERAATSGWHDVAAQASAGRRPGPRLAVSGWSLGALLRGEDSPLRAPRAQR